MTSLIKHLPNALTLLRLALAPVVAWLMWVSFVPAPLPESLSGAALQAAYLSSLNDTAGALTLAAILFVVAALTDLFDGMIARAFDAHSKFGRLIDPIADKAIVGLPLIVAAIAMALASYPAWLVVAAATAVIVVRDVSMTLIRLLAPDGEGARVSSLAKIKTALELVVVGALLIVSAIGASMQAAAATEDPNGIFVMPFAAQFEWTWLALLVITAALSAWTGLQYLRPKTTS